MLQINCKHNKLKIVFFDSLNNVIMYSTIITDFLPCFVTQLLRLTCLVFCIL